MKTSSIFFMVVGLGLGLGSCAPPTVPTRPSWDQDVFPILQGSCNHCHGETTGNIPTKPNGRMDFCDPKPFMDAGITGPALMTGAVVEGVQFIAYLKPVGDATRPSMPPPPAAELTDYERDVLMKWAADPSMDKCNKQGRNRDPQVRFLDDPVWNGNDVTVRIEVWDPDKDQVLGKVNVGAVSAYIPGAGRREVVVTGANRNDEITVLLHDGYVEQPIVVPAP
jgi:hypothetical protein